MRRYYQDFRDDYYSCINRLRYFQKVSDGLSVKERRVEVDVKCDGPAKPIKCQVPESTDVSPANRLLNVEEKHILNKLKDFEKRTLPTTVRAGKHME